MYDFSGCGVHLEAGKKETPNILVEIMVVMLTRGVLIIMINNSN